MSSPTWTPESLSSELRPYTGRRHVWRLADSQSVASTRKLVDSFAERDILEALVDDSKPPVPSDCQGLDPLLTRPFRYAPYPKGSRFRRSGPTPGVYYAAEERRTAVAETAVYRLLFFAESPDTPWPANPLEFTGFSVEVGSHHSLDLTKPPFEADAPVWRHPVEYAPCQDLADTARKAGAEILRYASARDRGACVAVLTCRAFAETWPRNFETWRIGVTHSGAYAFREFQPGPEGCLPERIEFDRNAFASDPRIAAMRWER
jgi:RES domain